MKISFVLRFFVIAAGLLAMGAVEGSPSITWQKLEFEQQLKNELRLTLMPLLPASHFILDIDAQALTKGARVAARSENTHAIRGKAKYDSEVLLSKLGIWPPAPMMSVVDPSPPRNPDLFDNIRAIDVTLVLDESVPGDKRDLAHKIIEAKLNEYHAPVKINVSQAKLLMPPEQRSAGEWFNEMKIPLASIFCCLLIGAVLLLNNRRTLEMEREKIDVMRTSAASANAQNYQPAQTTKATKPTEQKEKIDAGALGITSLVAHPKTNVGFARMKRLLAQNPNMGSILIKQWLNTKPKNFDYALLLLAQSLNADELEKIATSLSEQERRAWADLLTTLPSQDALQLATSFLCNQITESILSPPSSLDEPMRELFASLTPKECVACAKKDPRIGGLLFNHLNTFQVARMVSMLPPAILEKVLAESAAFEPAEMNLLNVDARKLIQEIRSESVGQLTPFLKKAASLIREVNPDSEGAIFSAIAHAEAYEMLEEISKSFFPAELIAQMPNDAIQAMLRKFTPSQRAEIIFALGDEEQAKFLKVADSIDTSTRTALRDIENKPALRASAEARRSETWRKFVIQARAVIRSDAALEMQAETLREAWMKNLIAASKATDDISQESENLAA